ncbi:hypothetical protein [Candidatus Sororendozoicomonas aggregata]|uniref:hypothetical protein n=1 Tax=Candidatus Sororendozoicomonas aggregata TaxID=3073239 RepID=UPI002ED3D98A
MPDTDNSVHSSGYKYNNLSLCFKGTASHPDIIFTRGFKLGECSKHDNEDSNLMLEDCRFDRMPFDANYYIRLNGRIDAAAIFPTRKRGELYPGETTFIYFIYVPLEHLRKFSNYTLSRIVWARELLTEKQGVTSEMIQTNCVQFFQDEKGCSSDIPPELIAGALHISRRRGSGNVHKGYYAGHRYSPNDSCMLPQQYKDACKTLAERAIGESARKLASVTDASGLEKKSSNNPGLPELSRYFMPPSSPPPGPEPGFWETCCMPYRCDTEEPPYRQV